MAGEATMTSLFNRQYLGGSEEAEKRNRLAYEQGRQQGLAYTVNGTGQIATAQNRIRDASFNPGLQRAYETQQLGGGQQIGAGSGAITNAQAGIASAIAQPQASAAEALALRQQAANTQAMQSLAGAVRGGSQASALRTAQATGAANAIANQQQLAVLRAQEQAQQVAQAIAGNQAIGQLGAQQQQVGLSRLGLGLGGQQQMQGIELQGAQAGGQLGLGLGNLGLGQQNLYTNAGMTADQIQLAAEQERQRQRQAFIGGMSGAFGSTIGGLFGGGAGASAGGSIGKGAGSTGG